MSSLYQDDMFGGATSTISINDIPKDLSWAVSADYRTLHTVDEVKEMLAELRANVNKPIPSYPNILRIPGVDTETRGLFGEIVGASFCAAPGKAYYLPFGHRVGNNLPVDEVMPLLKEFLEEQPGVYANASYDWQIFADHDIDCNIGDDTMVMSYLYDVSQMSHGLKQQTKLRLGIEMIEITDLFPKPAGRKKIASADIDFSILNPDDDSVRIYACSDADCTLRLREWFAPKMKEFEFIYSVEKRLIKRIAKMERIGFKVDKKALEDENEIYKAQLEQDLENLYKMFGRRIEINSPKQLASVLFNDLGLPILETTKSGAPSTSSKVLAALADDYPVVKALIDYKSKSKLQTAFLEKLPKDVGKDGRIHTSFNQCGAKSGRICSSGPNLMQIPKKGGSFIRKAFIPEDGYYIFDIDYSQIEYRVFSSMAQEKSLMDAFINGEDFHAKTAALVFNLPLSEVTDAKRKLGKIANFAILYGVTPYGLAKQMGISEGEAEQIMSRYFQNAPNILSYIDKTKKDAMQKGYIKTYFGRKRELPELKIPALKEKTLRKAVNTTIQGTAADILKIAMVRVDKMLNEKYGNGMANLLVCVHDELVFEVHESIPKEEFYADVAKCMEIPLEGFVPIKADPEWGPNWGSLESLFEDSSAEEEVDISLGDEEEGGDGEEPTIKVQLDTSILRDLGPVEAPKPIAKPTSKEIPALQFPAAVLSFNSLTKNALEMLKNFIPTIPDGNDNLIVSFQGKLLLMNKKVQFDSKILEEFKSLFNAEVQLYDESGRTKTVSVLPQGIQF